MFDFLKKKKEKSELEKERAQYVLGHRFFKVSGQDYIHNKAYLNFTDKIAKCKASINNFNSLNLNFEHKLAHADIESIGQQIDLIQKEADLYLPYLFAFPTILNDYIEQLDELEKIIKLIIDKTKRDEVTALNNYKTSATEGY